VPAFAREIDEHLSPRLSPTQWRRAATSLGAWVGVDPGRVARRIDELLASAVLEKDYGVAGCLVWGLAYGAELEPEAAEELLYKLVAREGSSLAEAFEEGVREQPAWRKTSSCALLRRDLKLLLALSGRRADDGWASLATELLRDLAATARERPVRRAVNEALAAFGTHGARRAHELAQEALVLAREQVATLEAGLDETSPEGRRETYAVLRDLDISLLESAILPNLLALDRRVAEQALSIPAVEELHDRVCRLFIGWEAAPLSRGERPAHATLRLRRLKALIHLLDVDADPSSDSAFRVATVRERWLHASHAALRRLIVDPPSEFHRSLAAALARAIEGLVRAEVCDTVDALLFMALELADAEHFKILAEASKHPDLIALLNRYETFVRAQTGPPAPDASDEMPLSLPGFGGPVPDEKDALVRRFEALAALASELSGENSSREEVLRAVLGRLARALARVHESSSLAELASPAAGMDVPLAAFEEATSALGQLVTAARLRLAEGEQDDVRSLPARQQLGALARAVERSVAGDGVDLRQIIVDLGAGLSLSLPAPIALLATSALERVPTLPRTARRVASVAQHEIALPAWLPPRRTLGGFYVVRPLGAGGVGSVFVVRRIEERNDPQAESFALKVPDYSAQVARHMSEADFLGMFQNEASALLSLPSHKNLARFVTFDLAARPKPILVMELVDGLTLETLLARRQLTTARALGFLDGVLAGLQAMHRVGVAHLDLKPTNVVMRKGEEPVLVDFGLAGRHIRLGCGSGPYGAPEVWGLESPGGPASPTFADVYAIACLTYETLTTQPLFDQENELALTTAHLSHDGWPTPLRSWHRQKDVAPLAELLGTGLRRNPRDRIDAPTFRSKLAALASPLARLPWPLSP
jgi:hypothetical protein